MKYPKHIILDLSSPLSISLSHTWESEFLRKTTVKFSSPVLTKLRLTKPLRSTVSSNLSEQSTHYKSLTISNFDINFLRKEKIYTKLKYSRCPQYDIVSGGFAAIFAGFIGFLISEKFGIELVDSGDFYIAFMYGVFAAFSIRPLIRIYSKDNTPYTPFSPRYALIFIRDLLILALNAVYRFFNSLTRYL